MITSRVRQVFRKLAASEVVELAKAHAENPTDPQGVDAMMNALAGSDADMMTQINKAFDQLQHELEESISEKISETRQAILENFDEEVSERLKMNRRQTTDYVTKVDGWLWEITTSSLDKFASIDNKLHIIGSNGENYRVLTEFPKGDRWLSYDLSLDGNKAIVAANACDDSLVNALYSYLSVMLN